MLFSNYNAFALYAEDGCGIALGFDETKFNIGRKLPVTSSSSDLCTGLFDCIYDENVQKI